MGRVCTTLGVVTGGALVRLIAVNWVVVVVMGWTFAGFSVTTDGFSGLPVLVVGPRGGEGGNRMVVLDGGRAGRLPWTEPRSLVLKTGEEGVEEVLEVDDGAVGLSLPAPAGEGGREGAGFGGGCLGSGGELAVNTEVFGEGWL